MASKVTKWAMDWATGIMTCTIEAIDKVNSYDLKAIYSMWDDFNEIQKHGVYTGIKPKMEDSTAKNADLKQTPLERYAQISNMWDRLTVSQEWSTRREREESVESRMRKAKVISNSMAKAAILLGMKVGADTQVVSDEEYEVYLREKDSKENPED
jgi:hypothetical protein